MQILGINSLKSLQPPLESMTDQRITGLALDEGTRKIKLVLEQHIILVDMARTGIVVTLNKSLAWQASDRTPMPTARVLFSDGSALDFKEPAKTKRISFTIQSSGEH
jgi:hypothetical protein